MLPGKLCIGILEEDNPYKAYFRLKPLLVEKDGRYEPFEATAAYPEEGCIRIVPDKNESSHFKARMRRMGRYCVLDLRDHAGENNKIRPNKNYRGDESERNAFIVYSDVVREPAPDMIFEVAQEPRVGVWHGEAPGTPRLVGRDGPETWAYLPPTERDGDGSIAPDGQSLDEATLQRFDIPGFPGETLHFAIRTPGSIPSVTAAPRPHPIFEPRVVTPAPQSAFAQRPPMPAAVGQSAPAPSVATVAASATAATAAQMSGGEAAAAPESVSPPVTDGSAALAPEPSAARPEQSAPEPQVPATQPGAPAEAQAAAPAQASPQPEPVPRPQPASRPQPAPRPDKPWISRDFPSTPPVRGRITNLRQSLEAQSGLNPRRSRSLQEVIEEKWRHSRVDQLGHPVPANATGQPLENPLDRALDALRAAWRIPELRDRLLGSISEMDEFSDALSAMVRRERDGALRRDLEELEAERLKSLDAVEKLRREKRELRESFKKEIREEEAEAFRDAVERTRAAQEECEKQEAAAREARKATAYAEDFLASLSDGRFEERLKEFAFTSKAVELLRRPAEPMVPPMETPCDDKPAAGEWIERVRSAFAAEGLEIDAAKAANLLICASLSDLLLISGPASSDKDATARAIARALGALKPGRCLELSGKMDGAELKRPSELPRVAIVRGANGHPGRELDRGLCGTSRDLLVIATLNDSGSGFPVNAEALEQGFLVRLEATSAQTPWRPANRRSENFTPLRMSALRDAFLEDLPADMPAGLERRLQHLRDALAQYGVRLSRRTLDLMWQYCAAMNKLNRIPAGEALDMAFAQKALPCILAEAPLECLVNLRRILSAMPHSLALLDAPLPIMV